MENNFHELLLRRHSIRKYTDEELSADDIKTIVEAGLLAPTSKNARSWSFTVVDDTATLEQLSKCKPMFATPIARCKVAVVVSGNPEKSDVWIEDTAIAAAYMQLQVEALGLGSCWIQVRNRMCDQDETASECVKNILNMDGAQQVLCVITIGHKDEARKPVNPDKLKWEQVHVGVWKDPE